LSMFLVSAADKDSRVYVSFVLCLFHVYAYSLFCTNAAP